MTSNIKIVTLKTYVKPIIGILTVKYNDDEFYRKPLHYTLTNLKDQISRHCESEWIDKLKKDINEMKIQDLYVTSEKISKTLKQYMHIDKIFNIGKKYENKIKCEKCGQTSCSAAKANYILSSYFNVYFKVKCFL